MTSFQCNELKHELDETINVKITLIRFDGDIIYIQNDFRPIFNVFVSDDVDHNVPVAKTFFNMRLYNQSVKETCKCIDIIDLLWVKPLLSKFRTFQWIFVIRSFYICNRWAKCTIWFESKIDIIDNNQFRSKQKWYTIFQRSISR